MQLSKAKNNITLRKLKIVFELGHRKDINLTPMKTPMVEEREVGGDLNEC